jgi:predicted transcriptional regulator
MSQLDPYEEYEIPWEKVDLFFLRDAVKSGMPYAKIAGFLGRTEADVREKSRALKLDQAKRKTSA